MMTALISSLNSVVGISSAMRSFWSYTWTSFGQIYSVLRLLRLYTGCHSGVFSAGVTNTCVGSSCSEKVMSGGLSFLGGTIGITDDDDTHPDGGATIGVILTVNPIIRGVGSILPAISTERTVIVWEPFVSEVYACTDVHATYAHPSILHWKVEPVSVDIKAILIVDPVIVAPDAIVVPVETRRVSGATVSTVRVTVPVALLPTVSVIVRVGLDPMSVPVPEQVTVPPVDGVGVQVVPGMETVAPDSTSPVVMVTSPPLLGFGVAVVVGTTGAPWSVTVTVRVTVFPVFEAVSV
jgi:hypothetical protein